MNKKTVKIVFAVIAFMMMISVGVSAFAFEPGDITISEPTSSEISNFGGRIIGAIQVVGVVVSVVILLVLGIKYMMGSAEEKAEYKKSMVPYLVGAVLIFAASTIANIIYNFIVT